MNHLYRPFLLVSLILISACSSKKDIIYTAPQGDFQEELLDTLVITDVANAIDSLPAIYRSSATLVYDIIHTKLNLKFDWTKQHVLGIADLTIKPYFKSINQITLDAVGFDIHKVSLANSDKILTYTYDESRLVVTLDRTYTKDEQFMVHIAYTAKPNENVESGSDAITSDKGLFFIEPLDLDPEKPTQIWTQGETENNSRWFPTFDKPNERFTQEIILTVDDKYLTLSNGKKISSTKNTDGTRTDYWKQELPHAPYLAMIAVGEFDEEVEEWNKIPLHYMVGKGFGKYAKKIFNHTPEMLGFFSNRLKYPYPWDKYGQVVVDEFVSGAMENTGAVVFSDMVQKTERELIDNDNDYIVAHEMMHHWFGDLVTCEDWSNLTLNEGFANYAEYLWFEHKYGKDRAEYHRMNEMNGYFGQVFGTGAHPLIHYYYDDKGQMFDAHSYNKGGLVLHMLRNYVGDEAFFASLNKYLTDNAFTAVEVDELRLAFEDTTGEDLQWFFDQWFLNSGHPQLNIKYTYNKENKVLLIETDMSNAPEGFYKNFRLPLDVAIYYGDGSVSYHPVVIDENEDRLLIEDLKADPVTYVLDGKNVLLGLINENKTPAEYKAQFLYSQNFMDKMIALSSTNDGNFDLIKPLLKEKFYFFRVMGIGMIPDSLAATYVDQLQEMVLVDPHSEVRKEALIKLLNVEDFDPQSLCKLILKGERAYPVLQIALEVMGQLDAENKASYIQNFKNDESDYLASTIAGMMTEASEENLDYLEKKAASININYMVDFYTVYQEFLLNKDAKVLERSARFLEKIAANKDGNIYRKYLAMTTLIKMAEDVRKIKETNPNAELESLNDLLKKIISDISKNEQNATLIEKYEGIK